MPTVPFAGLADAARASPPQVAMILGSGMGPVAWRLRDPRSVPFHEVPGLGAASVHGHKGLLTLGEWAGRPVLIFEGRLHYYEGHPWRGVVAGVHAAHFLGAKILLLTNAAGGIRDDLEPGSLMAIRDHLEWTRADCWRHPGPLEPCPPRPSPYSPRLLRTLAEAAQEADVRLSEGIYATVTGPSYETAAEIRAMKTWGADAVGMSTAREVQAGHDAGLECAAISCITNRACGLGNEPLNHEEVITTASAQSRRLADLLETFLNRLDGPSRLSTKEAIEEPSFCPYLTDRGTDGPEIGFGNELEQFVVALLW